MFSQPAKDAARRIGIVLAVALLAIFAVNTLRGPQGLPALMKKEREIRDLQEKNADLMREIQMKRDRLKRLRDSQDEQEQEIRKRLKLLRPGETSFILPDGGAAAQPR